jgi:segregation and condensation protein A
MDDVSAGGALSLDVSETAASEVFVVELAEFSGPLDLLLSLIRDEQIDIYDIPIARIAEQFLARI